MLRQNIKIFFLISPFLLISFGLFAETKDEKATFAGGCFCCMEHPLENL